MTEVFDEIAKKFSRRSLLSHNDVEHLHDVLASIDEMDDFQTLYARCVDVDDLTMPFVNRNLVISRAAWQSNYQRLTQKNSASDDEGSHAR